MLRQMKCVRGIAREIASAADGALEAYREGRVQEEPQITDRIIGAIEDRVRRKLHDPKVENHLSGSVETSVNTRSAENEEIWDQISSGIVWKARSLRTSAGIAAEEKRHGADLMGILDIDIPDYRVVKGFLVQAKRAEPGQRFPKQDWDRLHFQCEMMLQRTPDSFIWVYSKKEGLRIFSACSVLGLKTRNIFDLYSRSVSIFFEYHIECFIGDTRLNSTDIQTLDVLAKLPIKSILKLSARQST